jgi:hypothetical protein
MAIKTKAAEQRENIRKRLFPDEETWIGTTEKGWFRAPRTLPLVLSLIDSKDISGNTRLSNVYLELWARDMGEGLIEMKEPSKHAYWAGYSGPRGVRTWQERMRRLEELGFIKIKKSGTQPYGYVLLMHPAKVIENLQRQNKIPADWLDEYSIRQFETKETTLEQRKQANEEAAAAKVINIKDSPAAKKTAAG